MTVAVYEEPGQLKTIAVNVYTNASEGLEIQALMIVILGTSLYFLMRK